MIRTGGLNLAMNPCGLAAPVCSRFSTSTIRLGSFIRRQCPDGGNARDVILPGSGSILLVGFQLTFGTRNVVDLDQKHPICPAAALGFFKT
jgi:hypothetical protein